MRQRIAYLIRFYLTTVLLFIVAKLVFMVANRGDHPFSLSDMGEVVWHGLSLDLSTALYFLALPFLLTIVSVWVSVPRWLFSVYHGIVAIAFALAFVADTSLYPFWGFKLDASCLQYLSTPTDAMASVSTGYLLLRLLAIIIIAAAIWGLEQAAGATGATGAPGQTGPNGPTEPTVIAAPQKPQSPQWPKWPQKPQSSQSLETILYLLLIPAMVIGIRGGLDESTTNIGQVYYSQDQFLNHSAVNPVFSFLSSFEKTANYVPDYHFMDDDDCENLVASLFPTESTAIDTLLNTPRPNVVVILMESCGAIFTGLEGRADVMPRLQQLMQQGVSFDSCYANSWRTDRGTVCTYSGYPSFPVSSVMKMPSKSRHLPGLASTLAAEGYHTSYLYGGDINFTNMRSYLVSSGFERITWKHDFTKEEQQTAEWGVRDDIMFAAVARQIAGYQAARQPFFIGFSTLSSHQPWDVPLHQLDDEILNAFYYLDTCIGTFIDSLKQTPAWDNLLIVLLPDHGIDYNSVTVTDPRHDHIPMVWTGGAVRQPRRLQQVCSQSDLPATLLGQMHLPHNQFRYSRDVTSSNYVRRVTINTYNNGIAVVDSTQRAMFDLNAQRIIQGHGTAAAELVHIGKAVLQSAALDLKHMN